MRRKRSLSPAAVLRVLRRHGAMNAYELAMLSGHGASGVVQAQGALDKLRSEHRIGYEGEKFARDWQIAE